MLLLCFVSICSLVGVLDTDLNSFAVASNGEKISSHKDVLIRPRGYAELKGMELDLNSGKVWICLPLCCLRDL